MNRTKKKNPTLSTHLTVVRIVDDGKQRPEGRSGFLTDEPRGCHTAEPGHSQLEASQGTLFVRIMRIDFAQNVLITVGRLDGLPVSAMNFQHRFNYLFAEEPKTRSNTRNGNERRTAA